MLAAVLHVLLSFGFDTSDSCRGLQLDFSEGGVAATAYRHKSSRTQTHKDWHTAVCWAQKAKWVSSSVTALNTYELVPWSYSGCRCGAKYDLKSWFQCFEAQLLGKKCKESKRKLIEKAEYDRWKGLKLSHSKCCVSCFSHRHPVIYTWCTYESAFVHTQSDTSSWPHAWQNYELMTRGGQQLVGLLRPFFRVKGRTINCYLAIQILIVVSCRSTAFFSATLQEFGESF